MRVEQMCKSLLLTVLFIGPAFILALYVGQLIVTLLAPFIAIAVIIAFAGCALAVSAGIGYLVFTLIKKSRKPYEQPVAHRQLPLTARPVRRPGRRIGGGN